DDGRQQRLQLEELERQNRADSLMLNDSLALALAEHFDHHGTPNEQLRAYYILGRTYAVEGNFTQALEAYNRASDRADTTTTDCDYHTLSLAHTQMAEIFHRYYLPQTAIKELTEAQRLASLDADTLMAIECYFDQANEYERLGMADTALAIATEASIRFAAMGQYDRAAAAKNATVLLLLDKHLTHEAKTAIDAYLSSAYTDSLGNVSPGREIFYYKRGLYYLQAGQADSAEYFFRKELHDGRDINNQIAGSKGLQLLYEKLGNADSIAKYAARGYSMSDSVYMVSESQNIQAMQAIFDYTRQQLLLEQKTNELSKIRFYMVITVISLVLVILIIMYIAQQRDKQHALAAANYQTTIRELSLDDRLCSSPIALHLQKLASSNPPKIANLGDIKLLKMLVSDNIPSFFSTVNPSGQPLSEQEYVVCLLTRIALPSASADRITGVSEGYTSRLKSRLYKKLTGKDGSAKDFEHWIAAIR
ncbi:MAG: hypothetical protein IJ533_09610, partial [Prevotella sp.]|nr:hypothetical protein [Prevotella sp.]